MNFLLLLALSLHVASGPTAWRTVPGQGNLQYRWSRPASNACDIEFQGTKSKREPGTQLSAGEVTVTAVVQTHAVHNETGRKRLEQNDPASRDIQILVFLARPDRKHLEPCIGITDVRLGKQ